MTVARALLSLRRRGGTAGPRALRLYAGLRRHRTRLLAAAVALGILFMVIHWG